jgi:ketosteroid isomerase-like protein
MIEDERKQIELLITTFFEAGRNKDFSSLASFHLSREAFSKFDESPPYTRQNSDDSFIYEQAAFANISDYTYSIDDLRIDILDRTAVATFYLTYKGIFVNDYSFEGSPVGSKDRVSMVFVKTEKGWRLVHEHFSRFPGWGSKNEAEDTRARRP